MNFFSTDTNDEEMEMTGLQSPPLVEENMPVLMPVSTPEM